MGDLVLSSPSAQPDLVSSGAGKQGEADFSGNPERPDILVGPDLPPGVLERDVYVLKGDKGDPGDPGGGGGSSNVYIGEQPFPTLTQPSLVIELNPDDSVKTMWVGTNP